MSDIFTPGVGYSRSASLIESQITLSNFKSAFDFTLSDSPVHGKMVSRDLVRTPTADRNAQNYKFEYEDGRVIIARAFQDYSLDAYDSQWNFTVKAGSVNDITERALGSAYKSFTNGVYVPYTNQELASKSIYDPGVQLIPGGSLRAFDLVDNEFVTLQMDLQGRVFEKVDPQRAMVPPDHTPTPGGIYNPVNTPLNTIPNYYQGGYTPSETPLVNKPIDVTPRGFEDLEQNLEPFCRVLPSVLEIAPNNPPSGLEWLDSLKTPPTPFDWSTATRSESTLPPGEELFPTTAINPEIQKAVDEFFKPKDQPSTPSWTPGGYVPMIDLTSMTPQTPTPSDITPQTSTTDPLLLSNDFWIRFEKPLNGFEVSPVSAKVSTNALEAIAN
jgi:hypothetical protein